MSVENKLIKIMKQKGYENASANKENGSWNIIAFNPLQKEHISHVGIGRNFGISKKFLEAIPDVPSFYVCAYFSKCDNCGKDEQPIGFNIYGGGFIQKCRSCDFEWVAITAEEQDEQLSVISYYG